MRASQLLERHKEEIKQIARRYEDEGIYNLRVFGSVAKGLDTEESDLDFLVDARRGVTLFTLCELSMELERLLGVKIDLITSGSLPDSSRSAILSEAAHL